MLDVKSVIEGLAVATPIVQIIKTGYDMKQSQKKSKPLINVEFQTVWDSVHLTFANDGPVTVRLSNKFGIITPKGNEIVIAEDVSDHKYPYELEQNKSFQCRMRLGLINAHLSNEGSNGLVEIRYFIRDNRDKIYTSDKAKFSAFDMRNPSGKTLEQVQWQWAATQN